MGTFKFGGKDYSQLNEKGEAVGIRRFVGYGISETCYTKIYEDDPGGIFRFGRIIYGDGTFHIGWIKRDFATGWGIGDHWTNG